MTRTSYKYSNIALLNIIFLFVIHALFADNGLRDIDINLWTADPIADRFYIEYEDIVMNCTGLFVVVNEEEIPINSLHVDANGFYIKAKENLLFLGWVCRCGWINAKKATHCANCGKDKDE